MTQVQVKQTFRFGKPTSDKPYEGSIKGSEFKIKRIISYQNSFLPILAGSVDSSGMESILKVKIRLNYFVLGFVIVWMSGVSFVLLAFSLKSYSEMNFSPEILIPMGMFAFGYLLTTLAFKYESKKYRAFLEDLLELKEKGMTALYLR